MKTLKKGLVYIVEKLLDGVIKRILNWVTHAQGCKVNCGKSLADVFFFNFCVNLETSQKN